MSSNNYPKGKWKALVLEGGGVKGIAYWGLGLTLRKAKMLQGIECFAGASIGALFALIFALDIPDSNLNKLMYDTNFSELVDFKRSSLWDYIRGWYQWGLEDGKKLEKFMEQVISTAYPQSPFDAQKLTFGQFYTLTGKHLMVTSTNLNRRKTVLFSSQTTPNAPVVRCVHMSMAYPGGFEPVLYEGDYYLDGGIGDNFPQKEVFRYYPKEQVLGAKLITPDETTHDPNSIYNGRTEIKSQIDLIMAIVDTMQVARENQDLYPGFWKQNIALHVPYLSIFEVELSKEQKKELRDDAIRDTENFLAQKFSENSS